MEGRETGLEILSKREKSLIEKERRGEWKALMLDQEKERKERDKSRKRERLRRPPHQEKPETKGKSRTTGPEERKREGLGEEGPADQELGTRKKTLREALNKEKEWYRERKDWRKVLERLVDQEKTS